MTSDGAGRDKVDTPVDIDAQIWVIENVHEIVLPGGARDDILTSLRTLKRIQEAKMPEPVAYIRNPEIERLMEYGFCHAELSRIKRRDTEPLYGPEVIELLAAAQAERDKVIERHKAIMADQDERYADLLRNANAAERRADLAESKLAKVMEGLREANKAVSLVQSIFDEDRGDIDGGWLQDKAVECGVLIAVEATERCIDPDIGNCACAEYGDFPMACYRLNPALLSELTKDADKNSTSVIGISR